MSDSEVMGVCELILNFLRFFGAEFRVLTHQVQRKEMNMKSEHLRVLSSTLIFVGRCQGLKL